jgi:hypothetical protein
MILASVSHTPLPDLWKFTLRQITEYARTLSAVMRITNPWVSGEAEEDKALSTGEEIRLFAKSIGRYKPTVKVEGEGLS